jgi:hypothetical protein
MTVANQARTPMGPVMGGAPIGPQKEYARKLVDTLQEGT